MCWAKIPQLRTFGERSLCASSPTARCIHLQKQLKKSLKYNSNKIRNGLKAYLESALGDGEYFICGKRLNKNKNHLKY